MTLTTRGHSYFDDGRPIPSVTTILNAYPKQLTKWAAETVAGYAVDNWDELAGLTLSARLRKLNAVVWERRDRAALSGRKIHELGEKLVAGGDVEVAPEYRPTVESYARWLDAWDVQPIAVERPLINRAVGYAGRPDLLATMAGVDGPALVDLKTGSAYDSHVLQVAAYANAERYLDDAGEEQDWPTPVRCYVVRPLTDHVEVLPLATEDGFAFLTFRHLAQVWKWTSQSTEAYKSGDHWPIGEPIVINGATA